MQHSIKIKLDLNERQITLLNRGKNSCKNLSNKVYMLLRREACFQFQEQKDGAVKTVTNVQSPTRVSDKILVSTLADLSGHCTTLCRVKRNCKIIT